MYLQNNPNGYCNHRIRFKWAEVTAPLSEPKGDEVDSFEAVLNKKEEKI